MLSYDELRSRTDAPPRSSWGLFGERDEIGMLNLLTPELAVSASKLVRRGKTFNLDLALDGPPLPVSRSRRPPTRVTYSSSAHTYDDYLDGFYLQGGSQIDGLRHFRHPKYGFYNGFSDDEVTPTSATIGVGRWSERGIVGRGVLADVGRYRTSIGQPIEQRVATQISVDDLDAALAQQNTTLAPGDILLMRTGWLDFVRTQMTSEEREALPSKGSPSPGLAQEERTLEWIWEHQLAMIAGDNTSVEAFPPRPDPQFEEGAGDATAGMLHYTLIPLMGMPLGELWDLDALAADCVADGRWEFLLVAKPLNVTGGIGSPPNAIAIK